MQALSELVSPTAVTHAVGIHFLNKKSSNLVVAKTSLLQIFEVESVRKKTDGDPQNGYGGAVTSASHSRLSLVSEYDLAGTVTSLAAVKIIKSKSGGSALLISFKDAKVSLVEWEPETHSLSTISIHFYEGDEIQINPWMSDLGQCRSFLTVDPSSRCAALKFGKRQLAIIPFRQQGDDLVMGEDNIEATGNHPVVNGNSETRTTPYGPSFVLPLTALDPSLIVPIDLAFLFEYREPTIGILSASRHPGPGLLEQRKDVLTYTVFTLDLEQHARTPLLSVSNLPSDLFKLVPLPLPVGGTLLIGGDEIIHVDQAGKTHGIGVNDFARQSSAFPMSDQSSLELKLEGCNIVPLQKGFPEMLLVLNTGNLVILAFKVDGRSVSGLSLQKVPESMGGSLMGGPASCAVVLENSDLFLGASDCESLLVHCNKIGHHASRKRSHAEYEHDQASLDEEDDEDEDEDDLYGHGDAKDTRSSLDNVGTSLEGISFFMQARLPNLAPMGPITVSEQKHISGSHVTSLVLAAPVGRGRGSKMALLTRFLHPLRGPRMDSISNATGVWKVNPSKPAQQPNAVSKEVSDQVDLDELLIVSTSSEEDEEASAIFSVTKDGLKPRSGTNFEEDTSTLDVGTLVNGTMIVQVTRTQLNCYDADLSLTQMYPMLDEVTDTELTIVHTSFTDPYLLVVRNDSSITVLNANEKGEVDELDRGDALLASKWLSGCLYKSTTHGAKHMAYLLSATGGLHIFELPNLEKAVYVAETLCYLPPILLPDVTPRRAAAKDTLTEILVAELGDEETSNMYLIVRTANDDVALYQPYRCPATQSNQSSVKNLRWAKVPNPHNATFSDEQGLENNLTQKASKMRAFDSLKGYKAVFIPGAKSGIILKESCSLPRVFNFASPTIRAISEFKSGSGSDGLIIVDAEASGHVMTAKLPLQTRFDFRWPVQQIPFGENIEAVTYHAESGLYVLGMTRLTPFKLPEDDWHRDWVNEDISFKPSVDVGVLRLVDPSSWSTINEMPLGEDETILCVETLDLEVSELTGERKRLITVGTSVIRGEDLQNVGNIYIFEIITVVPEPDRPETNRKLRLIVKEEVKGPVTAVSEIASQGLLIMSQGQKCMVRGLKEDNTLLPVAFLDVNTYVTSLRTLKGTGMALIADAVKGVWFTGFSDEPNKIAVFGKSRSNMDVVAAEFLPHQKELFLLVADTDCNLHVFEYNPERQRLLLKSTFHIGHFPTAMTLLPSTYSSSLAAVTNGDIDMEDAKPPGSLYQALMTSQSGALLIATPLEETTYRRLGALQTHLTGALEHTCGLNPRVYRNVESEGFGSRGVLDGNLLQRWNDLGSQRRADACTRVGAEEWQVRSDLEMLGGGGLGYL